MRRALGIALCLLVAASGCSEDSAQPQVEPVAAPRAPEEVTPTSTSPTAVTLSWRDVSTDETAFRIERSVAGANSFVSAGQVNANVRVFVDRGVTAEQTFDYRIRALREEAVSEPSEIATVTATANVAPSTPSGPTPANRIQDLDPATAVTLAWTASDPDGDALVYDVRFGQSFSTIATVSAGQAATEYALGVALEPNRSYFWQVIARDPAGVIRRSSVWVFSTVVERQTIPSGHFVMGGPAGSEFEHPGNPVDTDLIDMDRFEITNTQFVNYLNQAREIRDVRVSGGIVYDAAGVNPIADVAPATRRSEIGDPDSAIGYLAADSLFFVVDGWENFPVVQVSWYGAQAYAAFFGRRLPTEAEWEKAARGTATDLGTETYQFPDTSVVVGLGYPYPWGSSADLNRGNFDNTGDPFENQGRVRSTPVGYYDGTIQGGYQTASGASPYGCDDMAGNVWEWVEDAYDPYQNPHNPPATGHFRVIRGGDYERGIGSAQTWNRSFVRPESRDRAIGFRTVGDLAP